VLSVRYRRRHGAPARRDGDRIHSSMVPKSLIQSAAPVFRHLHIRNLAVVEEVSIDFSSGFNVLTGETGAGKSIVVDSLALLAGARASADAIRTGTDLLTVTGVFEPADATWRSRLRNAGLEADDDVLVVRREISLEGRNRVFINDQPATLRLLAEVTEPLIQIHSQREELALMAADHQRVWLDRVGEESGAELLARVAETHDTYRSLAERWERLTGDERLRRERVDLLRFQLEEIDAVGLEAEEDVELQRERGVLRHLEAVTRGLGAALELAYETEDSAHDLLARAARQLEEVSEWEGDAAAWGDQLEQARILIQESARSIQQRLDALDPDPGRLDAVESRLARIERLTRKYGDSASAVLEYRRRCQEELEELEADQVDRAQLREELAAALERYRVAAMELSAARRLWSTELQKRIQRELGDLALKKARFEVQLAPRSRQNSPLQIDGEPVEMTAAGFDQVVFRFAPNPGEEMRSLSRIASGGELARVYLALQLAVRGEGAAAHTTMVFDEVDAGVGGAEAAALGEKLQRLAAGGQVLAVTHLAQVASHADQHFRVGKRVTEGRTHVDVAALDAATRVDETARMLAGSEVTNLSRSHAEEMIQDSRREAS
jgi:DNA repair protein RecN (Recombination protein N)